MLLRQLVADLLPAFSQSMIGNRFNDLWTELESNHGFIQVLRNDAVSIRNWLGSLPEELCRSGLRLGPTYTWHTSRDGCKSGWHELPSGVAA